MKLYEIDRAIEELVETCVDPETGEFLGYEALEQLQMDRESKIEGLILKFKNISAEANMVKAEEANLTKRRKTLERQADGLKEYLARVLAGEKFKTARCSVSYRSSTSLEVLDADAVAAWLEENGHFDLVKRSAPEVVKKDVKQMIQAGVVVPGAEIRNSVSIQVR